MKVNKPRYIIIHHSLTKDWLLADVEAIRKYHIRKGWNDIGYHYVLEYVRDTKHARIYIGRTRLTPGAHALGFNTKSIGICVVGNFDKTTLSPTEDKYQVLVRLIMRIMQGFDIPVKNIIGHRETYKLRHKRIEKTCPGSRFDMVTLRSDIKKLMNTGGLNGNKKM